MYFYAAKLHGSKSCGIRTKCEMQDMKRPMTPYLAIT